MDFEVALPHNPHRAGGWQDLSGRFARRIRWFPTFLC